MGALVREVAEREHDPVAERLAQADEHLAELPAVRTQEIHVRDDLDRAPRAGRAGRASRARSADMIALAIQWTPQANRDGLVVRHGANLSRGPIEPRLHRIRHSPAGSITHDPDRGRRPQ